MTLPQAIQDIEHALDTAHANAALLFSNAAKAHLQRFNLTRHQLKIKTHPGPGVYVAESSRRNSKIWWELGHAPHPEGSLFQAIAEIGSAFDELPEPVQRRLDKTTI